MVGLPATSICCSYRAGIGISLLKVTYIEIFHLIDLMNDLYFSRDVYKESSLKFETSCIGTQVEVQSLQILSFLYCICHVLVVVQDSLADPNLIR